jgi:hypothetical protein
VIARRRPSPVWAGRFRNRSRSARGGAPSQVRQHCEARSAFRHDVRTERRPAGNVSLRNDGASRGRIVLVGFKIGPPGTRPLGHVPTSSANRQNSQARKKRASSRRTNQARIERSAGRDGECSFSFASGASLAAWFKRPRRVGWSTLGDLNEAAGPASDGRLVTRSRIGCWVTGGVL